MENNDLISRSELLEISEKYSNVIQEIQKEKCHTMKLLGACEAAFVSIISSIKEAPAVDAVPVVRCGECINYGYRNRHWDDICLKNEPKGCRKWLDKMGMFIIDNPNDFCSYGERKEPTNE